jgi:thiol:disulfide interchange protein DsbC
MTFFRYAVYALVLPCAIAAGPSLAAGAGAAPAGKVYSNAPAAAGSAGAPAALDPVSEQVKKRFNERFPGIDASVVKRTPYGLFEVLIGMDMVYTDENVNWVLRGQLIDAMTRRDVTQQSLDAMSDIAFDQLPLDLAFRQVKGQGRRKLAIFEDPNCGYCKQLRKSLESVDDVTIYTFLYPILSPDSSDKARDIWCAADPARAYDDWMLRGRAAPAANCAAPLDKLVALGRRLMVRGTPTLYFGNGGHESGAIPLEALQARLDGR